MLANVLFAVGAGLLTLVLSATPALFGGDLSIPLLVISFGFGLFLGIVTVRHHGSAAAAWRHWKSPPS